MDITSTRQHPDLVIWSVNSKKVIIAELTIPFEINIDWAHQCQLEKYKDLREKCVKNGWSTDIYLLEIGCRGIISNWWEAVANTILPWHYVDREGIETWSQGPFSPPRLYLLCRVEFIARRPKRIMSTGPRIF